MPSTTRPIILVVDDEKPTRAVVCRVLGTNGYDTLEACDASTALSRLSDEVVAVVSDYGLGDSDGLTLLEAIAVRRPELPTVMMSGHTGDGLAERAKRQGVRAFLHKPFEAEQLIAALGDIVGTGTSGTSAADDADEPPASEGQRREYDQDSGIFRGVQVPDISETMSMIAHDVRSSLATVLMAMDELCSGSGLDDRQRRLVRVAERNARQLEVLASELSELGSTGSGRLELARGRHDLTDLVWGIIADMSVRQDARARIIPRLESGIHGNVDAHRFGRAVTNVVGNAQRFAESAVVLTLETHGGEVRLVIEDDGPGIPEPMLPHVFQPFVRGHQKRGTGLGLAITREIIRAHGGRVTAMNRTDGPGARFELCLPKASE